MSKTTLNWFGYIAFIGLLLFDNSNNYWMRFEHNIIKAEVCVICRSRTEAEPDNTKRGGWIILDI